MQRRTLGKSGIEVSALSFGAGPISGLMTGDDAALQRATIGRAIEHGINWFDTAATYGAGGSETALGAALADLAAGDAVHVATKVRLIGDDLNRIEDAVRASVEGSLRRLRRPRVTLLQLHNSITPRRGDEPTSITPGDVLKPDGVLAAFNRLRAAGLVEHFGLTGIGHTDSLSEVAASGAFTAMQVPYHLLNPSAGRVMPAGFAETDYHRLIDVCSQHGVGVIAIRVFAGGALVGQPPAPHTHKTKFFPLDLYRRDEAAAASLAEHLPTPLTLKEAAVRFVLGDARVSTALIGLADPAQVDEAVGFAASGPLDDALLESLIS